MRRRGCAVVVVIVAPLSCCPIALWPARCDDALAQYLKIWHAVEAVISYLNRWNCADDLFTGDFQRCKTRRRRERQRLATFKTEIDKRLAPALAAKPSTHPSNDIVWRLGRNDRR
jgi:hypothetical protein